jgi:tetratricopeptide (TPR) repeat protein
VPDLPDTRTHDDELLDRVFDDAVQRLEDGLPIEVSHWLAGREELRPHVERLIRLAEQVAVGRPRTLPTVPGYTLLSELGHGGMGTVYLARQESLGGRPVALKVMAAPVTLSPTARERFRTEARAIARLRHPNIVAVHDVVQEADVCAYAMEWVDGKSLAELIEHLRAGGREPTLNDVRQFLSVPAGVLIQGTMATALCRIGIAVARALAAVHQAGLLHRDVKPANILLRRDGTPLLSDFGLVREADAAVLTQAGHFVGTPAYAAPEQLAGGGRPLDARTDVYALGVTLYHALSLRLPFTGDSTAELLRQIETGRALPLRRANPHLSSDLETIVAKAMEPEPDRRYQTADELADDLERLLSLQPIRARPAGLMTRAVKLARRHRGGVAGAVVGAALALILALLIGGYLFVVPRWVDGHVRSARLSVLDPGRNDTIFEIVYWGDPPTRKKDAAAAADLLRGPLASYDAALRLRPTDADIRLERDVVRLARELLAHPERRPELTARLCACAGLACTYAELWIGATGFPRMEAEPLETASATELRSLGLLAYLCVDIDTAMQAWSRLDLMQDPDPFVEASLGQLYLLLDQPAKAYPRLRSAYRAYPEAGFLCVSLADAALQCGDFAKAETLLTRARTLSRLDPTKGLERVQADLYAATGRDDLAVAIWTSTDNAQCVAQCHHAQYLEAKGNLEGAARAYGYAGSAGRYRRAWDGFRRVAPGWWDGLTPDQRWQTLRASLDEPYGGDGRCPLARILLDYVQYALVPDAAERTGAPPKPGSFEAAAVGLYVPRALGFGLRFRSYPRWLKDLHATVLLSPWPVHGSLTLAALDAAGRRLELPGWPDVGP